MRVAIYATDQGSKRGRHLAQAMLDGFRRHRVDASVLTGYAGVEADLAVAYGWNQRDIFLDYQRAGRQFIFLDLGYWGRRGSRLPEEGYHRFAVDSWDTLDGLLRNMPPDRFDALGVRLHDWVDVWDRKVVIVAGMSGKAAWTHGYPEGEWERRRMASLERLLRKTGIRVELRPKPSKRIRVAETVEQALDRARVLYTHHSNMAIDAIVRGIPCCAVKGVGRLFSPDIVDAGWFVNPFERWQSGRALLTDEHRRQVLADIAYAQWSPAEMRSGAFWEFLLRTGRIGGAA